MADLRLGCAQAQIIVLRPVELTPELQGEEQPSLHHKQMADIIVRQQIIVVKIRLAVRLEIVLRLLIAFILIRIEDLAVCLENAERRLEKGIRLKEIVMVEKGNVISVCRRCRRIGIR